MVPHVSSLSVSSSTAAVDESKAVENKSALAAQRNWEAELRLIVEGIAAQVGDAFFRSCVQYLAELLQIKYAFIAEYYGGERPRAKVLSFWAGKDFGPTFEYDLAGTPCGVVISDDLQVYPQGIQQLFPDDQDLVTLEAESYVGIAIRNSQGQILGHIAGLHTQPLTRSYEEQTAILKIFAARSAAEIERQSADRHLKKQNLRLAETLEQLKRTQVQLIQAEKMSGLGSLVAGIAHEINNPISFIEGNLTHANQYYQDLVSLLGIYQQVYPEPEGKVKAAIAELDIDYAIADFQQLMNSMQTGTQRVTRIIESLRNFSRLDEAIAKRVDLHEGLEATLDLLQHRLREKGDRPSIDVIKDYGELPQIFCYPAQLNQVFLHVLNNAIDAIEHAHQQHERQQQSGQGHGYTGNLSGNLYIGKLYTGKLWLRTESDSKNVVISIADNGLGISEALSSKIFDPFFTTKTVGDGTGLGLSISYQIVTELHNGELICRSSPCQSSPQTQPVTTPVTTFKIRLPLTVSATE